MKAPLRRSRVINRVRLLVAVIAALALGGGSAGSASAAELSSPGVASWNANRFDLVVRGEDGMIYHKYWDSGTGPVNGWSHWGSIGAPSIGAASSPTVTSPGTNVLQVFVRGKDNFIWNNHWTHGNGSAPGGWSGWGKIPNTGNATWAPSATNGGDSTPDVFYTGSNGATYYFRYDNQMGWVPPVSLGGYTLGSPAATTTVGGRMQIAVRGSDSRLYHNFADNPYSWTGFGVIPNSWTSMSPALTFGQDGQFNMFFRDYNSGNMHHVYWDTWAGWIGPGHIAGVNLVSSPGAARRHVYWRHSNGEILGTYFQPGQGWLNGGNLGQPSSEGKLYREQNQTPVYLMESGVKHWVTSIEAAHALELDLNSTLVVPDGSLHSIPPGENITMNAINEPGAPTGQAAASNGWRHVDTDPFEFRTSDEGAVAYGAIKWFRGSLPSSLLRRRGEPDSHAAVVAIRPMDCIWAQVKYGYPLGSATFPPSGSISPGEHSDGFYRSCRKSGQSYPPLLSLWGLGYAKFWLSSATVTICVSYNKSEGRRHCSNNKVYFGLE